MRFPNIGVSHSYLRVQSVKREGLERRLHILITMAKLNNHCLKSSFIKASFTDARQDKDRKIEYLLLKPHLSRRCRRYFGLYSVSLLQLIQHSNKSHVFLPCILIPPTCER